MIVDTMTIEEVCAEMDSEAVKIRYRVDRLEEKYQYEKYVWGNVFDFKTMRGNRVIALNTNAGAFLYCVYTKTPKGEAICYLPSMIHKQQGICRISAHLLRRFRERVGGLDKRTDKELIMYFLYCLRSSFFKVIKDERKGDYVLVYCDEGLIYCDYDGKHLYFNTFMDAEHLSAEEYEHFQTMKKDSDKMLGFSHKMQSEVRGYFLTRPKNDFTTKRTQEHKNKFRKKN